MKLVKCQLLDEFPGHSAPEASRRHRESRGTMSRAQPGIRLNSDLET